MKTNVFSAIIFGLLSFTGIAQSSFVVEYDKKADEYKYIQLEYENGKKTEKQLKRMPKLEMGDVVTVRVKNYNPFLYHVEIRQKPKWEVTGGGSNSGSMLSLLGGGLTTFSNFSGVLSSMQFITRSEEAVAENMEELEMYTTEANKISSYMNDYSKKYNDFLNLVKGVQEESFTDAEQAKSTLSRLKEAYRNFQNPSEYVNEAYPKAKTHYNKAGVSDRKVKNTVNDFDYQYEKFKKLIEDPTNHYTKKGLEELMSSLENAKFETARTFEVVEPDATTEVAMPVDGQNMLSAMIYEIKFYDVREVQKMTNPANEDPDLNYVKYYFSDRFWDSKGNLVDQVCIGCEPVLKSEGLYRGEIPRNPDDLVPSQLVGKWMYYDRNGELEKVEYGPELSEKRPAPAAAQSEDGSTPAPVDLSMAVTTTRKFEAPMSGAIKMNMSTGMYGISSFSGRKSFLFNSNEFGDTLTISSQDANNLKICIGTNVVVDFPGNKFITPSIVIGAAVDFWDESDIHFVCGGGIKFKKFPFIGVNGGVAFTRVTQLNPSYREGVGYQLLSPIDPSMPNPYLQKKYVPGFYLGLSLHF